MRQVNGDKDRKAGTMAITFTLPGQIDAPDMLDTWLTLSDDFVDLARLITIYLISESQARFTRPRQI
jgi:hypothetical protein